MSENTSINTPDVDTEQATESMLFEDLVSALDRPDYEERSYRLHNGQILTCKLKVFKDFEDWRLMARQMSARIKQSVSPAGWSFNLPDGSPITIKSDHKAGMLTLLEFGVIEPSYTVPQWAALISRDGALFVKIAGDVDVLNGAPSSEEEAKNDLGQDGGEQPD
jgi:hypothetical protein